MHVPTGPDIRAARKRRSLSQTEVAKRADVSQPLLSRVESNDVNPRLTTLHRIAAAIKDYDDIADEDTLEVAVRTALKQWRQDAGLTQDELAERAGVSQPMIARIENEDVNPRASTVGAIFSALGDPESVPTNGQNRTSSDISEIHSEDSNFEANSILNEIRTSFDDI